MIKRISMWSGPRNISTALMYSFAQRSDTHVVDEPLYGHYLRVTGADHPGASMVMEKMNCNGNAVVRDVILGPASKPILFIKNMAHHLVDIEHDFLKETINILLVRDPYEMLLSLVHQIPDPVVRDTGLKAQAKLLDELVALGQQPVVLDARQVLQNPRLVLNELCLRLKISFEENMLSWPAGAREYDGVWAKYWYREVHKSTGFKKYKPKSGKLSTHLLPLLQECRKYYSRLYRFAIKTDNPEETNEFARPQK